MSPNDFTHLGARIRAGVTRNLLNGARIGTSVHGSLMLSPAIAGASQHATRVNSGRSSNPTGQGEGNLISLCEVASCEDQSVCGV